ncbi:hypothetical protein Emed_000554 [Eimeria media]
MQRLRLFSLLGSLMPLCLSSVPLTLFAEGAAVPPVVVYEQSASAGGPYYQGGPYAVGPPSLTTAYAETAMPAARGRRSVFFGAFLLLLLLVLTEWRVTGRVPSNSWKSSLRTVQDKTANIVNTPFVELNRKLEEHGKAISARLVLFMSALVFLVLGAGEVVLSARQRQKYKRVFPMLKRAPSLKISAAFALLAAAAAFYGLALAWPHVAPAVSSSPKAAATAAVGSCSSSSSSSSCGFRQSSSCSSPEVVAADAPVARLSKRGNKYPCRSSSSRSSSSRSSSSSSSIRCRKLLASPSLTL